MNSSVFASWDKNDIDNDHPQLILVQTEINDRVQTEINDRAYNSQDHQPTQCVQEAWHVPFR